MDYDRHLAVIRHEAEAFATAVRHGLDAHVPSCPGWQMRELAAHATRGFRWVTTIVRTHADAEVDDEPLNPPAGDPDPATTFEQATAELVETLVNEGPDAVCWNWSEQDLRAAFWARRMANEIAVHRWDAELAHGEPHPIEPTTAADGVAESLDVFLGDYLAREPQDGLSGTFLLTATDTGDTWTATLYPDHADLGAVATEPDATITGTVSDLMLALWGRDVPVTATGDERITGLLTA